MHKPIYDITPHTLLDFPDRMAAIIWFSGCPLSCGYCQNPDMLTRVDRIGTDDALAFLQTRRTWLEGVVLSGGECTAYAGIVSFCEAVKSLGFEIKIDTNGVNPDIVSRLIEKNLVDYIALDYKATKERFCVTTGSELFSRMSETLDILLRSHVAFEIRTTVYPDFLHEEDIEAIIRDIRHRGYKGVYYLQKARVNLPTLASLCESRYRFDFEQFNQMPNVAVR